jgi:HWE histidine kinase
VSARGQGNDTGTVGRIMYGIFLGVTGRKQAEEGHELLAGEMSHRVKNLLAIASSLTAITPRSAKTTAEMAKELTLRLTALGRALWLTCNYVSVKLDPPDSSSAN